MKSKDCVCPLRYLHVDIWPASMCAIKLKIKPRFCFSVSAHVG